MRYPLLSIFAHVAVLGMLLTASPALGQDRRAEVRALLESRDADIKRLLGRSDAEVSDRNREALRDVINGILDFRSMSREALGPHWDGLTEAQRNEFVDVFSAIIRGQSLSNLDPYRARVTYESIDVDGSGAHVVTRTVYKDAPITVAYDMAYGTGGWHVTDIILDDVSTVEGYARSFQTMVRKRGFDTLMERLRQKRAEVETDG